MRHKSVLLQEAIQCLEIKKGEIFVDGTLGGGGHTEEVQNKFGDQVKIIGIDLDLDAISLAKKKFSKSKITFVNDSFRNLDLILKKLKITKVNKILLDIGISSNQFEESGRGFTFQKNEPLLMTMKRDLSSDDLTAKEIVNNWEIENLATIIKNYGEEQFAWKIAKAIVARRIERPIETTFDLVEIIKVATPKWYHHKKIHPATKTFQALRVTVNDEIGALRDGLKKGFEALESRGRLAVISFHSLEDREVKHFFREKKEENLGKIVNKKPITPTKEEIKENPRSRSAKLRIIEKI